MKLRHIVAILFLITVGAGVFFFGRGAYEIAMTLGGLLRENKELKQAITNLTAEEQIGYAKVVQQYTENGKILTKMRFVETSRHDKLKKILEKEYTIEGDIVHFDALIVKFGDKIVQNGQSKALYLWRRVYGESQAPANGFTIEEHGAEPQRYKELLNMLPPEQRQMFWSAIWELANDPEKLREFDIKAVYGNAVYMKLRPGLIYVFKISATGQLYPEVVPEI